MAMSKRMVVLCVCAVVAMTLMASEVQAACSLNDLAPCLNAVTKGALPSGACCAKVAAADVPCFCNLVANSNYPTAYVNNAVNVPKKCGGAAYSNFKGKNCAGTLHSLSTVVTTRRLPEPLAIDMFLSYCCWVQDAGICSQLVRGVTVLHPNLLKLPIQFC